MTEPDTSTLLSGLPPVSVETFGKLSENDEHVPCLDASLSCSALKAVNFDKVKEAWYNDRFPRQVRSCDAIYKHGDRYYLIEFKTGVPEKFDLHRKLYDSVIGIVDNGLLSLEECRDKVQCVIVSLTWKSAIPAQRELLEHYESLIKEPWDYTIDRNLIDGLKGTKEILKLTGFLVNKIFLLNPSDFERFAKNRSWCN